MAATTIDYLDGDVTCEGYVARPEGATGNKPCVIIAHQWAGLSDHERQSADKMAKLGYVALALDVYGKGNRGDPSADNSALMNPWVGDRLALRKRLLAAVEAARALEGVDPDRIAVMGYCFGGLCALDIARSGTDLVKGTVSIHGIFAAPDAGPQAPIKAKVLILHGWADPMAQPDSVVGVAKELTDAGADWQLHAYGHAMHAFTAPAANAPAQGMAYDANADRRSWQATCNFFAELFA